MGATTPDRALVVGEAVVDVVISADGGRAEHPGGSPANVALTLARLGRGVDLLTSLGDDAYGTLVRDHLEASGVALVPASAAVRTSSATATLGADGGATYRFDLEWEVGHPPQQEVAPVVVHTGSIAAVLEPGAESVTQILAALRGSSTITYDPNVRPSLMGDRAEARQRIEAIVAVADVVKVSDEDLAWLAPGTAALDLAGAWLASGPSLVVVTRGAEGAFGVTREGVVEVPPASSTVVDTVGAGDSFMGGLIDGLWAAGLVGGSRRPELARIDATTLHGILTRCAAIAGITVSRAGANPPTAAELARALAPDG